MSKTLTVSLWYNFGKTDENAFPDAPHLGTTPHAQKAMEHLGITYETAEPRPICDCWRFYKCQNIPDELPSWISVSEGGLTMKEHYENSMSALKTKPEPKGQKFPVGTRVKILSNSMHGGSFATVAYTYAHAFGGHNVKSYCLDVDGFGTVSWFDEDKIVEVGADHE